MREPRSFSLAAGGPFNRVLRALHLTGGLRGVWLGLLLWLPFALGELVRIVLGKPPDPTLFDLSVHARLLVAIPMILQAERLVESAARSAIRSMYEGHFCDQTSIDVIVDRGEHLRDLWWPETIVLAAAVAFGQLALWTGSTGAFHGATGAGRWELTRVWYVLIALPVAQFVIVRFAWLWGIWSYMLARIARLPLAPLATHPDRAGGLSCLARPVTGFGGYAFGCAAVLSGAWGTQLLAGRTTVSAQLPELLVFLVLVAAVAIAPLLLFSPHLYRIRRRNLADYGDFAMGYMRAFHEVWIASGRPPQEALGSPHLQSMNDLGGAYTVVSTTKLFVFSARALAAVWASAMVPMLPLFASTLTVEHVVRRIVGAILGGIPL
jgi:hypothetical protein